MKESMPSKTQPPQAAKKPRRWFGVSGTCATISQFRVLDFEFRVRSARSVNEYASGGATALLRRNIFVKANAQATHGMDRMTEDKVSTLAISTLRLQYRINDLMARPLRHTCLPGSPFAHKSPLPFVKTLINTFTSPPDDTSTRPLDPSAATESLDMNEPALFAAIAYP